MNKSELVAQLSSACGQDKFVVAAILGGFMETVTTELKAGNDVTLLGFGTFSASKRPARVGRNPRTGVALEIPATKVVKFKVGASLNVAFLGSSVWGGVFPCFENKR
jgi:DNA-binding protein HU-beta